MSDNRKYYYLKLKESYFDDDAIVLLESMQDGMLYSNILLKLYLKSLKYGGTGTSRPRRLRQIQKCDFDRYGAFRTASRTARQVGVLH